jgi:hypothetical protein
MDAALVFVCALTLLVSLLFSFVPLLRASRNQPSDALKVEGRGASAGAGKRRLGQMFAVSEFLFSLVLLILGVLLVQSFINLRQPRPRAPRRACGSNGRAATRLVSPWGVVDHPSIRTK